MFGTLVLQIPNQSGQPSTTGIVLELPDFSQVSFILRSFSKQNKTCISYIIYTVWTGFQQVDPDVFAALPKELQEELCSAYRNKENAQAQSAAGQ